MADGIRIEAKKKVICKHLQYHYYLCNSFPVQMPFIIFVHHSRFERKKKNATTAQGDGGDGWGWDAKKERGTAKKKLKNSNKNKIHT